VRSLSQDAAESTAGLARHVATKREEARREIAGVQFNALEMHLRCEEMAIVAKRLAPHLPGRPARLSGLEAKPTGWTGVVWSDADDAALLFGVHRHGFGAWEQMCADPDLASLAPRINLESRERPGTLRPAQLERRLAQLIRALRLEAQDVRSRRRGRPRAARGGFAVPRGRGARRRRSGRWYGEEDDEDEEEEEDDYGDEGDDDAELADDKLDEPAALPPPEGMYSPVPIWADTRAFQFRA
jgi:hypothetical protein